MRPEYMLFVATSSTSVLLFVLLFFPEISIRPHFPPAGPCLVPCSQCDLPWLPYLNHHPYLPQHPNILCFLLWFVFPLLLSHRMAHDSIILVHCLPLPVEWMKAFGEQGFQTVLFIAESSASTTVAFTWDDYNKYILNELDEQVDLQKMNFLL